jgi:hypothetical protein
MDVANRAANCVEMHEKVCWAKRMGMPVEISQHTGKIISISALLAAILLTGTVMASIIGPSTLVPALPDGRQNCIVHATAPIEFKSFGTKVLDGDIDVGRMLFRFKSIDPVFAYWDVGITEGEFDPEDVIYLHVYDNTNATKAGDIRLTPYGYYLPGSRVTTYDTDIDKKLTKFDRDWDIVFADQFGSTGYDLLDPVYLHVGGNLSQIERLDLRLSNGANGPAGSLVDGLDEDRGLSFTSLTGMIRFYNANGNIRSDGTPMYDLPDRLYLDLSPRDSQGFVQVNDIRLT